MKPAVSIFLLFLLLHGSTRAQSVDSTLPPVLRAGTVELGFDGSLMAVEGVTQVSLMLRGGTFFSIADLTLSGEGELGYSHINAMGALDLQASIAATGAAGGSLLWPYLALSGGIRQEWIGSFAQIRYPVGADLGVRALLSRGAALRVAYRYRLVLNDPVSAFSEHRIVLGASILLENPDAGPPVE